MSQRVMGVAAAVVTIVRDFGATLYVTDLSFLARLIWVDEYPDARKAC